MPLTLSREEYRAKIHGGWLGKSIGSTLGAPKDGSKDITSLTFFDPLPGQAAAFDGLDFQLVWIHALRQHGPEVTSDQLASSWQQYLTYPWDEYGYALNNLRRGLKPAMTGSFDNWFRNGVRGAARADLWGMLAPGAPQIAAQYAYKDACIDHTEDGVWAAMFVSSMESAAFFFSDIYRLLDIGLAMIPPDSRVSRAVRIARDAFGQDVSLMEARSRIISGVGAENYSDAPQNIGFATLGLLYGKGDFGASIATAVNCGYASQFTGGAVGAVLGILRGGGGIPANWIEPIGESVVVGWGVVDLDVERTVSELVEHTATQGESLLAASGAQVSLNDGGEPLPSPPVPEPTTPVPPAEPAPSPSAHFLELDTGAPPAEASAAPTAELGTASTADDLPTAEPVTEVPQPVSAPPPIPAAEATPEASSAPGASDSLSTPEPAVSEARAETTATEVPPTEIPLPAPVPPAEPAVNWTENALVQPFWKGESADAIYRAGDFEFAVDHGASGPVILPGVATSFTVAVRNLGGQDFLGHISLNVPEGWEVGVPGAQGQRQMLARGRMARFGFVLKSPESAPLRTRNAISLVMTPENGPATSVEIPFFGGSCWWFVGPFRNLADEAYDHAYGPEDNQSLDKEFLARDGGLIRWQRMPFGSTIMDLERVFTGVPGAAYGQTTLHLSQLTEARLIVHTNDGAKLWLNGTRVLQRHSHEPFRPTLGYGLAQADVTLSAGDNRILLKVVRCGEPIQLSFVVADRQGRPLQELGNTRWA